MASFHYYFACSRNTVLMRAIDLRTSLIRAVFSNCPVANWNLRLNNSSFNCFLDLAFRQWLIL